MAYACSHCGNDLAVRRIGSDWPGASSVAWDAACKARVEICCPCCGWKPYHGPMDFALLNTVSYLERPDGLAAVPMEDGYALACRVSHPEALKRLMRITGHAPDQIVLIGFEVDALAPFVADFPEAARRLMEKYWPGPLVIRLPVKPAGISGGFPDGASIGLMQPDSDLLKALLSLIPDGVLAAVPACRTDGIPARTGSAVYNEFGDDVDYVLAGNDAVQSRQPPTVVSVEPGAVSGESIVRVLRRGRIVPD